MGLMRSLLFEIFGKNIFGTNCCRECEHENIDEVDIKRWQLVEDFYLFPYFLDFQEVIVGLKFL